MLLLYITIPKTKEKKIWTKDKIEPQQIYIFHKRQKIEIELGKEVYVVLVCTTNGGSVLFSGLSEIVSYLTSK